MALALPSYRNVKSPNVSPHVYKKENTMSSAQSWCEGELRLGLWCPGCGPEGADPGGALARAWGPRLHRPGLQWYSANGSCAENKTGPQT